MTTRRRRRRLTELVAVLALVAITAACTSSSDSDARSSSGSPSAPDDLRLPLIVGLRRDDAGLAAAALRRAIPKDPDYLRWMTPAEITSSFGASPERAAAVLEVLEKAGFEGRLDPTGGLLVGTMRVADAAELFDTEIVQIPVGSGVVAMPATPLQVPKRLADDATEVIGLVSGIDHDTTTTVPPLADPAPADPPCPTVKGLGPLLRNHYRLQPLLDAGATGKGVRMAMIEVSPTSQRALRLFSACRPAVRLPPVQVIDADPSSPEAFPAKAVESTLDIVAAGLIAPGLDGIDVYQVNPYAPVAVGLAAVLATATSPQGLAPLVSLSLGFCEPQLTDAEIAVSERLLMGASAMGTSVLASTGDFGSSACAPDDLKENVQYPASSPWVTGVGGTSLVVADGKITDEIAWGANGFGGGGGRTSRIPRPAWQADVKLEGKRIVPDVAFLADPRALGPIPTCDTAGTCVWQVNGGTSATAPGAAAGTALILTHLAGPDGVPRRLGALNPGLYGVARNRAAAGDVSGGYLDIVAGSNDVHQVGCCSAAPGYDAVTGLGVMDFWDLAQRTKAAIARAS